MGITDIKQSAIYEYEFSGTQKEELRQIVGNSMSNDELGELFSEYFTGVLKDDDEEIKVKIIGNDLCIEDNINTVITHEYELVVIFKDKIRESTQLTIPYQVFLTMVKDFIGNHFVPDYNVKIVKV